MVTLYQLNPYVDPRIREYGMFEFFGLADGPDPKNYLKVWKGDLGTADLEKIYGRLRLNRPEDYHGRELGKSDVIAVDGAHYFLDHDGFHEVGFDGGGVKPAVHVSYGYGVTPEGAAVIPYELIETAALLDIPYGYEGTPDYHGSHKDEADFRPGAPGLREYCYLHPHFLRGAEAKEFVGKLEALTKMENWPDIKADLLESRPLYLPDLRQAKEKFENQLAEADLRRQRDIEAIADDLTGLARNDGWQEALAGVLYGKGVTQTNIREITGWLEEMAAEETGAPSYGITGPAM